MTRRQRFMRFLLRLIALCLMVGRLMIMVTGIVGLLLLARFLWWVWPTIL